MVQSDGVSADQYRAMYETIVANAAGGIVVADAAGVILTCNAGMHQMLGHDDGDLIGQSMSAVAHPDDVEWFEHQLQARLRGEIVPGFYSMRLQRKDGSTIRVDSSEVLLTGADGPIGVLASYTDVSEREQAERNRELAERATVRSEFLSTMSHELRTPLNSILGFGNLLLSSTVESLSERQSRQAERIVTAGEHLLSLIDELLDISRIDAGQQPIEFESLDVAEIVTEVVQELSAIAETRGLQFKASIEDAPTSIVTDRRSLRQILTNLAGNALKFTDEGKVVIRASGASGGLLIEVVDTGIGIPADDLDTVFDEFSRVQNDTEIRAGTGLGLAITKKLTRVLGGNITVASEFGRGSTFAVWLPLDATAGEIR